MAVLTRDELSGYHKDKMVVSDERSAFWDTCPQNPSVPCPWKDRVSPHGSTSSPRTLSPASVVTVGQKEDANYALHAPQQGSREERQP